MKNETIINLEQLLLRCKSITLVSADSYKMFQDRRRLRLAATSIRATIQELINQDAPGVGENGNIDIEASQSKTFKEHYQALLQDETEVSLLRLDWEAFNAFCVENGFSNADIDSLAELLLSEDELNRIAK